MLCTVVCITRLANLCRCNCGEEHDFPPRWAFTVRGLPLSLVGTPQVNKTVNRKVILTLSVSE